MSLPRSELAWFYWNNIIETNLDLSFETKYLASLNDGEGWLEYFLDILHDLGIALVHVEFVGVRPVESFVAELALEPGRGGVGPVVTSELVRPDKAGPAVLVGTGEGPGPHVVPQVSLQVVPLGEGLPTVLEVTNVTV